MTQPDTGLINQHWEVEVFANVAPQGSVAVLSSKKFQVVSEAYFLSAVSTVAAVNVSSATVLAHGVGVPDQGTIGATLAATLKPQQFTAGFFNAGSAIGTIVGTSQATILAAVFLIHGT